MIRRLRKTRAGFTLIEILVTLIVLSVLVAAVFPVLIQQIDEPGPPRIASDLSSVKTAIEVFKANVRTAYPGDLEDLVFAPSTTVTTDADLDGVAFTTPQVARWKGPYLDAGFSQSTSPLSGSAIASGFDSNLDYDLKICNADGTTPSYCPSDGSRQFVAVQVNNITQSQAAEVNVIIDGANDASTSSTSGRWRWHQVSSLAFFFATPYSN